MPARRSDTPPTSTRPGNRPIWWTAWLSDAVFGGAPRPGMTVYLPMIINAAQRAGAGLYSSPSDIYEDPYAGGIDNLLPGNVSTSELFRTNKLPSVHLFARDSHPQTPGHARFFGEGNLIRTSYRGLGMAGMSQSEAIAADLLKAAFGPAGAAIISVIVAIAAITSINATIIVGARSSYAAGRDWAPLARLGVWDAKRGTPANALRFQCAAALLLVLAGAWTGSGFKSMVEFTAPVFWLFFLLSGISLFVLRKREPHTPRRFRVPLFPVLPLVFCAMCAYMLWASLSYVYNQSLGGWNAAWIGVAVMLAGAVLLLFLRRAGQPRHG